MVELHLIVPSALLQKLRALATSRQTTVAEVVASLLREHELQAAIRASAEELDYEGD